MKEPNLSYQFKYEMFIFKYYRILFTIKGIPEGLKNKQQIRIQEIRDGENANLLIKASDKNYLETVESLLNQEFDVDDEDCHSFSAVDYAWISYDTLNKKPTNAKGEEEEEDKEEEPERIKIRDKANKIILCLLNANSRLPKLTVEFDYQKASKEVQGFIVMCESLHHDLINNDFEALKLKLDNYVDLLYFYDRYNMSLLAQAFDKKKFEIINFLNRISTGFHENLDQFYKEMEEKKRIELRHQHSINAKGLSEAHLLILRSRSKIGNNAKLFSSFWTSIEKAFKTIDEDDFCSKILKVAAQVKKIKLYFDLKHEAVYYLDPLRASTTKGTTYLNGTIYIGAKNLIDDLKNPEVFGVLSHELCHLSMLMTYMNTFNPFPMGKSKERAEFEHEVMKLCRENMKYESIVENAFGYEKNIQESELIVTAPQILMHYLGNDAKIIELKKKYFKLFDYCKIYIEPALLAAIPVLEMIEDPTVNINYRDLTDPMKAKILNCKISFQDENTTFNRVIGNDSEILEILSPDEIRNILKKDQPPKIGAICELKIRYTMVDREFMDRKKYDKLKMERTEKCKRFVKKYKKNYSIVKKEVEKSKIFILSDYAGAGKTTVFRDLAIKLKKEKKKTWVSFIDLKKFEDVYNKYRDDYDYLTIEEIKVILIAIVEPGSKLASKIFEKLFDHGRVILFFDGIDEICPRHSNLFMKIFDILKHSETNNQIWISTRPHYAGRLERIFETNAHSLVLYNQEQKISYIKEILTFNNITDEDEKTKIANRVYYFIWRMNFDPAYFYETEYPLIIEIITELHVQDGIPLTQTSYYKVYHGMVNKQREKVGSKIPNLDRDIFSKLSVWDVHKVLALIVFIGNDFYNRLNYELKELSLVKRWEWERKKGIWTSDMIQRYGLVLIDMDDPEDNRESIIFTHETYAEFFVAQFIIDFLFEENQSELEIHRKLKFFHIISNKLEIVRKFIYSYLKHEAREDKFHYPNSIKEYILGRITEMYEYLKEIEELENLYFFELFGRLTSNDQELRDSFWRKNEENCILSYVLFKYREFGYKIVQEVAEFTFGLNWHVSLNKSSCNLITDDRIENFRTENDTNEDEWLYMKNSLKLSLLVDKNFDASLKEIFFERMNFTSIENSNIVFEIVKIMRNAVSKEIFAKKCLDEIYLEIFSIDQLKFIINEVENYYDENRESLKNLLFIEHGEKTYFKYIDHAINGKNIQIFHTMQDFYLKYMDSWEDFRKMFLKARYDMIFMNAMKPEIYPHFKKFVQDVFKNNIHDFADHIEIELANGHEISADLYENIYDFIKLVFWDEDNTEPFTNAMKKFKIKEELQEETYEEDSFLTYDGIEYDLSDRDDHATVWTLNMIKLPLDQIAEIMGWN